MNILIRDWWELEFTKVADFYLEKMQRVTLI